MTAPMQAATPEKRRTALNREVQLKIGQQLRASYNEVVEQGVPSRFLDLIQRLEGDEPVKVGQGDKEAQ